MDKYDVTNVDFGLDSVVQRKHAATNPAAWFYQQPITLEDHQQSRWIVEPMLRLLDCCQESDGGVAIVVTSVERGADLPHPPVRDRRRHAVARARNGDVMFDYYLGDLAEIPEAASLGRQMYEATGLGPADIDVAMIYENFTPTVFIQLEAFGFCEPGEATDFVAAGNIEPGAEHPGEHQRRPDRRGVHPRDEQHHRGGAPGARLSGQPGRRRGERAGVGGPQRPDPHARRSYGLPRRGGGATGGAERGGVEAAVGDVLGLHRERVGEREAVAPAVEAEDLPTALVSATSSASARVNAASSSCGTTWFTSPSRNASSAGTKLPVIDISAALRTPTRAAGVR